MMFKLHIWMAGNLYIITLTKYNERCIIIKISEIYNLIFTLKYFRSSRYILIKTLFDFILLIKFMLINYNKIIDIVKNLKYYLCV